MGKGEGRRERKAGDWGRVRKSGRLGRKGGREAPLFTLPVPLPFSLLPCPLPFPFYPVNRLFPPFQSPPLLIPSDRYAGYSMCNRDSLAFVKQG
jgi:hypothetical protein